MTYALSNPKLTLLPITAIARKPGLREDDYDPLGPWAAKLHLDLLDNPLRPPHGQLILVTATTPTTSGEGKTVTAIGLVQGLGCIGKKAIVTSASRSQTPGRAHWLDPDHQRRFTLGGRRIPGGIAGNMMLMPGLPKLSRAEEIDIDDAGDILGV